MEISEILLCSPEDAKELPSLTGPLLEWYGKNARDLPWRIDPTPYRVWVSEIMCQQTRVEAVRGYYHRFMEALPTVADLAAVEEAVLLKLWEGLGYYSRAKNLKRAAVAVMERHEGSLPASYAGLLTLPGIGEYTAGAIASIAFGIPVPAVDGNVYRVLSRILGSYADTSRPPVKKAFREAAARLLPDHRPGDLNQALMELGATVCLPNASPRCTECPAGERCAARKGGYQLELPVKADKKKRRIEERTVVLALSNKGVLLFRRGDRGLLAGLYEPLNLKGHLDAHQALQAIEGLGGAVSTLVPLTPAKHIFSHVEWHMNGWLAHCPFFDPEEGVWADSQALSSQHAVPSAFRAFFKDIEKYFEMYAVSGG